MSVDRTIHYFLTFNLSLDETYSQGKPRTRIEELGQPDRNLANILTKPVINKEGTKTVSTSDLDGNHRDPLLISKQEPWYIEDATIKDGRLD